MKRIRILLISILGVLALTNTGSAYSDIISGTIIPPTAGVILDLRDPFGNIVDSTMVVNPRGEYSLSTIMYGDVTVTPSLAGYSFRPTSRVVRLIGEDRTKVNFFVTPNNETRTNSGVVFSGPLGGFNSVADTHYSNGAYAAGGDTFIHGSVYKWNDASGAIATLAYSAPFDILDVTMVRGYNVRCGVSSAPTLSRPLCSSIGITFDKEAGILTFASTPIEHFSPRTSDGITVTGTLTFPPF